ncbi:MAG: arsenic resistance N-acetyltransferase ArsN2 [Oculatellaceae cyanobacterium Prado106]|jgi:amino-acid N-acetyltransferase|nr:arsenic resistance N-acetyltransferase ArsN2 [Oculatellaceae cyanobacterium Prado106]
MTIAPSLHLKPATLENLEAMRSLLQINQLPDSDIAGLMAEGQAGRFWLAYDASDWVGIAGIEVYPPYGLLRSIVVAEAFRGQGYGHKLCQQILAQAKSLGIEELYLLTNTAADFFERIGFEGCDRQTTPTVLQKTTEFSHLCPASATCMKLKL